MFGARLRKSLVIEGMCNMLCVVRICASSHVCDSERVAIERVELLFGVRICVKNHW